MNLKSLLQTDMSDLKNVKLDDVRAKLSKPMGAVRFLAVLSAVAVLFFGWSMGNKRKQALIAELGEKQNKLKVFQELQQVKNDYQDFLKALPQSITADIMIKDISELAEKNAIKMIGFVPSERKVNDLVKAGILDLNVSANAYENLAAFIAAIEQSSYLMRVERWSVRMTESASRNDKKEAKNVFDAKLQIIGLMISQDAQPVK